MSKKDNRVAENRENIVARMRQLAHATTKDIYKNALEKLKETHEWKTNKNFRRWLKNMWLHHKKIEKENT
jgi:hypothetical protein